MIVVTEGAVKHNGTYYNVGELIDGMSEADETRLVCLNICKRVDVPDAEPVPTQSALQETQSKTENSTDDASNDPGIDLTINPNELIKSPKGSAK